MSHERTLTANIDPHRQHCEFRNSQAARPAASNLSSRIHAPNAIVTTYLPWTNVEQFQP